MENQMCFDCLERKIQRDFSEKLMFCYGISDSSSLLPFGFRALVQVSASSKEAPCQLILVSLPNHQDHCLEQYIDSYFLKNDEDNNIHRNSDVNVEVLGNKYECDTRSSKGGDNYCIGTSSCCGYRFVSTIEDICQRYGSLEGNILDSLNLLIEGKPTGRDGVNFLSLVGMPSFDENHIPGCVRHPNMIPVLGMLKTPGCVNLLLPKTPYTLENILHYSPHALKSEWHTRFLIYQILSALAYIHGLGVAHGDICPSSIFLNSSCWCYLSMWDKPRLQGKSGATSIQEPSAVSPCCAEDCPCPDLYADLKLTSDADWQLAGRRWGDHTFHTVMPWVIDFSVKPDESSDTGWRDLGRSKWRLAKGDEQLDFTYSTSEMPHHARRLPLSVLRTAVRSVYEPNEYPSNMQRLYQWTPDECIPEFFSDPRIFTSLHSGMIDLAVPSWENGPGEFIKLHREALESNRVSRQIHHWIDITFGYKMSGQAAVTAKNVMLPSSEPMMPRSTGRRQLFNRPHPMRKMNKLEYEKPLLLETAYLQDLEAAASFSQHESYLSPIYHSHHGTSMGDVLSAEELQGENCKTETSKVSACSNNFVESSNIDLNTLLEYFAEDDSGSMGFQELLLWRKKTTSLGPLSKDVAGDIFSIGCIIAELYLKKPLFDPTSLVAYLESGVLPGLMQEIPPHTALLVDACIQRDWKRRPSAKCILESPYFSSAMKSSYLFLAPLHLLVEGGSHLLYAAKLARKGALKAMGPFAAEMCAPHCLPLVLTSLSDAGAESAFVLLKEFLKCLKPQAIKTLIVPTIQKILQAADYSHLKVSLLQDSFVREVWSRIGKQAYLETLHPLVIGNLSASPHKNSSSAASVLLIGSSEELGVPVTVHQCFGKGLCADGIDVLVRIGGLLGENFVVGHLIPLLKNVILSCINVSSKDKPEPVQNWNALALIDSLVTLDGLVAILPTDAVVEELVRIAATTLIDICQRIGTELTTSHILPQLKELFDELAFSQGTVVGSSSQFRTLKVSKSKLDENVQMQSRMDLVLLLYPTLASLLGIEKLRQCCATWLLLEQFLQRSHNWKWEYTGEASKNGAENINAQRSLFSKIPSSDYSPAKLLLNGVGWSIPQSQAVRGPKNSTSNKLLDDTQRGPSVRPVAASNIGNREPWFWFPSPAASWDGPDFLGRIGGLKDELPWKIRSSIMYSVRAHPGALRSLAVCHDESTVFTGGVGPGFKGTVQKWELSRVDCVDGYYGHEEVVNDICVLSSSGRIASCDGTIHVWNCQTGKRITAYAEPSANSSDIMSSSSTASKTNPDHNNMLTSSTVSGGIFSSGSGSSLYTCMHHLEFVDKLVAGTGNGSLRFIDVGRDQKLHLWRSESIESSFPSLVSAICSCGSDRTLADKAGISPSWVVAGLSSGHCRLLDARSGGVIAYWRAHEGYITKLASPEDHLLVSSSLDKTLRVWDLRRNWPSQSNVFRGHSDGVSGFSVWGQDIISISRNKIGLSSLSRSGNDSGEGHVSSQNLFMMDRGVRNLSVLSSISILPFSRLFLVGTEDGYLKICC
ncbi:hypothetical protein C5167_030919 [Papaver somniferum]|nr:hypothetical protein C5167_030919 [Papaver somniferum]